MNTKKHIKQGWLTRYSSSLLALIAVAFVIAGASAVNSGPNGDRRQADSNGRLQDFTVTHNSVVTELTTLGSDGHQLGDLRVLQETPIFDLQGNLIGRLDASLLTTTIDYPALGDEIRMSNLNFVFGLGNENLVGSANQIVVIGSGFYPTTDSTIALGDVLVRPIAGGSGRYRGARGMAITEHLPDDTWRHSFQFETP